MGGLRDMGRLQRYRWVAVGMILVFALSACSEVEQDGGNASLGSDDPVVVGFAIGVTGVYEAFDGENLITAQFAVDEINQSGGLLGRQIEIVSADNKSDPALSAAAGVEVISDGAELVVVSCDFDLGGPAATEAQSRGLISFSVCAGSSNFGPAGIGDLAFTMGLPAAIEGPALAEWAYNDQGWDSTFVMHQVVNSFNTEFCNAFSTRFSELAGEDAIVGRADFQADDPSYATQITALRSADETDFIMNCSFPPGGSKIYRAIRSAGFDQPLVNQQGMSGEYWKETVPNLSDAYNTEFYSIYGDDPDPKINELVERFQEEEGKNLLTSFGLNGYGLIRLWADAVEEAGTFDGEEVAAALEGFDAHPTPIGPFTFSEDFHMNLEREMRLMQVQNGKSSFVKLLRAEKPVFPDE